MQICISSQTGNHASIPSLSVLQVVCPSCRPTNSVKAWKAANCLIQYENTPYLNDKHQKWQTTTLTRSSGITDVQCDMLNQSKIKMISTTAQLLYPFIGLFSRTIWVSWHQKGKPFWILMMQERMWWQWHQLNHMQTICISLQTDNYASTSPLSCITVSKYDYQNYYYNHFTAPGLCPGQPR